jgi:hypothetical protein
MGFYFGRIYCTFITNKFNAAESFGSNNLISENQKRVSLLAGRQSASRGKQIYRMSRNNLGPKLQEGYVIFKYVLWHIKLPHNKAAKLCWYLWFALDSIGSKFKMKIYKMYVNVVVSYVVLWTTAKVLGSITTTYKNELPDLVY